MAKIILMFALVMCLYIGANVYVCVRMMQALSSFHIAVRVLFCVIFWVAAMLLFVSMALRDVDLPETIHRTMFVVGSVWMVFVLYMTLALILADLVAIKFPFKGGVWYALSFTLILLMYGYINYRSPRAEYIEVASDGFTRDLRIVAVSDIHLGYGTTREDLVEYVDIINREKPDIVLIAGDLIDNSIEPVRRARMEEELMRLQAPLGVYMSAGNHEYISGVDRCKSWLENSGVMLLQDSVVSAGGVNIVGRDDKTNMSRKPLSVLLDGVDTSLPTIVVDHQPYDISESVEAGAILHFSGHTHRGQVFPLNLLTDAMYEQSHGYRMWGATHVFVSSGLSLWGPPFRIGTHSDYLVIDCCKRR